MTKQEEIREGTAKQIYNRYSRYATYRSFDRCTPKHREMFLKEADKILSYLHSQGVVIKVERELPQRESITRDLQLVFEAVEPLIKE